MTGTIIGFVAISLVIGWLTYQVMRLRQTVDRVPAEGGVLEALRRLDRDLGAVEDAVADFGPRIAELEGTLPYAIQRTAVISFDAYEDVGGNLSRSIALLDRHGSGIVVTLLVSRTETRWFTKEVEEGRGVDELSTEEVEVVRRALGTMPR